MTLLVIDDEPLIRDLFCDTVDLHSCGAWPGQRIQHRMQLRADRIGEQAVRPRLRIAPLDTQDLLRL